MGERVSAEQHRRRLGFGKLILARQNERLRAGRCTICRWHCRQREATIRRQREALAQNAQGIGERRGDTFTDLDERGPCGSRRRGVRARERAHTGGTCGRGPARQLKENAPVDHGGPLTDTPSVR
jgi:hypothetical protein